MDYYGASALLQSIKAELFAAISALDEIASAVGSDFLGISSEKCARAITSVTGELSAAHRALCALSDQALRRWYERLNIEAETKRL